MTAVHLPHCIVELGHGAVNLLRRADCLLELVCLDARLVVPYVRDRCPRRPSKGDIINSDDAAFSQQISFEYFMKVLVINFSTF